MQFYRRQLPDICISFHSPEGKSIFREALDSGHMESYFRLAAQFRTQDEPAFCGLATLVMVLNALDIDPKRVWKGPWRWYHEEMLDCCTPLDKIRKQGITFDQFSCLAACNGLMIVEEHRMDVSADKEHFRQQIADVTTRDDRVLVSSYSRKVVQQTGDGHFAAIGGYHPGRDLVLLLDTARFKYPPHWLSVDLLWEAMQALDPETQRPRGFFLLEKLQTESLMLFYINVHLNAALIGDQNSQKYSKMMKAWNLWVQWTGEQAEGTLKTDAVLEAAVGVMSRVLAVTSGQFFFLQIQTLCRDLEQVRTNLVVMLKSSEFVTRVMTIFQTEESTDETHEDCCGEMSPKNVKLCVTAFLLAYPYPDSPGTWGHAMKSIVTDTLSQIDPKLLDELTRLREILSVLMDFAGHSCIAGQVDRFPS